MTAVTIRPKRNALNGFPVTFSIIDFNLPEELSLRLLLINRMPYKNSASPPSI